MKKRYYLLLVILAGAVLFTRLQKPSEMQTVSPKALEAQSSVSSSMQNAPAPLPVTSSTRLENEKPASGAVTRQFALRLHDLGECLQIKNALNENAEPTLENLNVSLHSELGDLIEQSEDWLNTHIRLPNGEERRLRIEVEGAGEESSVKILKYYGVDKESLPVRLALPADQTKNPSPSFIASLEKEGTVFLREKGVRGVYAQGAEIYYTEKNGLLTDFEMTFNKKTFHCSSMETERGSCRCL